MRATVISAQGLTELKNQLPDSLVSFWQLASRDLGLSMDCLSILTAWQLVV